MNFKFWLDDEVIIKFPNIRGIVTEIRMEGNSTNFIVYYKIQYWNDGSMYTVEFTDNELKHIDDSTHAPIGFTLRGG
jgi:hypothetical protein